MIQITDQAKEYLESMTEDEGKKYAHLSVNGGGYGGSILAICSKNYGAGTNTQSGVYLIKFHYDGNNTPSITLIAGSNLATFAQSASNTLTVAMGASNNMFTAIESSVVPTT